MIGHKKNSKKKLELKSQKLVSMVDPFKGVSLIKLCIREERSISSWFIDSSILKYP